MPMTPEKFQRVKALFEEGKRHAGQEREAFLERACNGDVELFDEVRSLLRSDSQAGTFLGTPAAEVNEAFLEALRVDIAGAQDETPCPTSVGTRIGRYRITAFIAEGAMGQVYEAEQDQPKRTVALKVLRRSLATPSALRRFQDEAQILARLRHPNVAQVFEAGTHIDGPDLGGGVLFFAMELIPEARTIIDFAKTRALSIRQRLELFRRVCDAVHHGHQKGIIHRDLKPANILVDLTGEPKVIDFGVARVTDSDIATATQETEIGQIVGTLQYMSPEQCDGDPHELDSRCDVYSLGAILYELLSGSAALNARGTPLHMVARLIREGPPRTLASFDPRFRGDLDAIVSKAMERNRDRRYQSAEALRTDIDRYLAGEPVEARPVSRWIRITRWLGRHPFPVSVGASAVIAGIVLGTSASLTWYNNRRPFEFWVSPDGRVAHLVTRFNRPLATLGSNAAEPGNVTATIVDRPRRFGGGRVALFTARQGANSTGQQLWMCRLDDIGTPIWGTSEGDPTQHPPRPASWDNSFEVPGYLVTDFFAADVFPDIPDEEIVVIHEGVSGSPNAVRVYDFAGKVLFEAWHFGHIARTRWWSNESLLVCVADRHGIKDIEQHGYVNPPPWPRVVFAIRPMRGERVFAWLNERAWPEEWRSGVDFGGTLAWYKVLSPRGWTAAPFGPGPLEINRSSGAEHLDVRFEQGRDGPGFVLYLNAQGEVIGSDNNDAFRQERHTFPSEPPSLVDWPVPLGDQ